MVRVSSARASSRARRFFLFSGKEEAPDGDGALARAEELRRAGLPLKQAAAQAAEEFGVSTNSALNLHGKIFQIHYTIRYHFQPLATQVSIGSKFQYDAPQLIDFSNDSGCFHLRCPPCAMA